MGKQSDQSQDFLELYGQVSAKSEELRRQAAEQASIAGYVFNSLSTNRPIWTQLANRSVDDPELELPLASGMTILGGLNTQLDDALGQSSDMTDCTRLIATSTQTLTANTTFGSSFLGPDDATQIPYHPCPYLKHDESAQYAARLGTLNPAIGNAYRQVWDTLHGTTADPERSALFAMRQVFDHLFAVLAPDDKVRQSRYWTRKASENPNQVTRKERIRYAANTGIPEKQRAKELAASAENVAAVYQKLNQAHKRGLLNPDAARDNLMAMDQIIRDWVDALQL